VRNAHKKSTIKCVLEALLTVRLWCGYSAVVLQAKTRGRQTRRRIAEEYGMVTRAVAGSARLALFYRPESNLDKKVQEVSILHRFCELETHVEHQRQSLTHPKRLTQSPPSWQVMALWHKSRRPQTIHHIRQKACETRPTPSHKRTLK
jgi:hypothetical protein